MNLGLKALMIYMAAMSMALAQTSGVVDKSEVPRSSEELKIRSVDSERARLGQQRIQSEAEVRAREEQQRLAEEEERARLGQQRIQSEAEVRAREEQQRLAEAEQRRLRTQEEAARSEEAVVPRSEPSPTGTGTGTDMSRTLQQLRSLGELKDDGYITEDEFQRIKQKILDSQI